MWYGTSTVDAMHQSEINIFIVTGCQVIVLCAILKVLVSYVGILTKF
jgi:hypothetical protein